MIWRTVFSVVADFLRLEVSTTGRLGAVLFRFDARVLSAVLSQLPPRTTRLGTLDRSPSISLSRLSGIASSIHRFESAIGLTVGLASGSTDPTGCCPPANSKKNRLDGRFTAI